MCIIFILIIAQFWTEMFDIVLQMNVSCSCTMPIMTEYLVDQEKYFYFILSWTNVIICIQLIVTLAIGITFLTFIQHIHICGMFKIARYKNKNINWNINIRYVYSRFINKFKNVYKEYMLYTSAYPMHWTCTRYGYIKK
jgi:hypothetical protein